MYGVYFWGVVAAVALLIGFWSRRPQHTKASKAGGKSFWRAIGSPLEFTLLGIVIVLIWWWGGFSGGKETFLLGMVGMLAVPIAIVFVLFRALGSAARPDKDEDHK